MAKVLALFAILACAIVQIRADDYQWTGGDMGFSNTLNWAGGNAPTATYNPCSTTFGGANATIISNLASGQYSVGQVLNLPTDGTLLLASDGTVINFADSATSNCGTKTSLWTGGLVPEQRNDFFCHTNWKFRQASGALVSVDAVPCSGDNLFFDGTKTYHTQITPTIPIIAVNSIKIGSVTIDDVSELSLGLPQINLNNNFTFVQVGGNPLSVCFARNEYYTVGVREFCLCKSTCPTLAMIQQADDRAREGILNAANQTLTAMNNYYTRTFTGTMNPASLLVSSTQMATALHNPSDATNSAVVQAIREALLGLPAASVTGVTVTIASDNSTVTVTGTLNATGANLVPLGFSSTNVPDNIVWSSTASGIPSNVTRTQLIVQSALSSKIFAVYSDILTQAANARTTEVVPVIPPIQSIVDNIVASTNPAAALTAIIGGSSCFPTCASDCGTCTTTLDTQLAAAGAPAALSGNIASLAGPNYAANVATIASIANQLLAARQAQSNATAVAMQTFTLNSPTVYIGRYSSLLNQLLSIASQNAPNVKSTLANAVRNFQGLGNITNMQIGFVSTVPTQAVARRRRAVAETPSGVGATFTYTTSCLPTDSTCQQPFSPTSSIGNQIQQRLDNTFNLLTFQAGQCFNPSYSSVCVKNAGQSQCTTSLGSNSNNLTAALADARAAMLTIAQCGTYPTYPNGTCLQVDPNAAENVDDLLQSLPCATTATTMQPSVVAASTSSGGGMSIVPIAAAAGGGALLLVIVIVLLMRRKRAATRGPAKKVDDRTVVAFENPMYDDPAHNAGVSQPVYDAAAPHDAEGLYDEPAFNQNAQKANPVYQSTEDLAAASEYMEQPGGPAKGDGYLDVAPGGGAEDVGYLDGVEKQ